MMFKTLHKKSLFSFLLTASAAAGLIFFGAECSQGALRGIYFCTNELVPPLFPFMALSIFTAKRGISLGKAFARLMKAVFGFSQPLTPVILLSMTGGYPVGAKGISALRESNAISRREAELAAYVLGGAGRGFLINFVGAERLGSREIGIIMLVSQICSIIILGIVNKLIFVRKNYNSDTEIKSAPLPFFQALTEAVTGAAYGMLEMCAMVVAFSALLEVVRKPLGVTAEILLEVTGACSTLSQSANVSAIAFAAGFGGICVHFQIFAALKGINIKKGLFFLYRIIQGLLTTGLTFVLLKAFDVSVPVFSSISQQPQLGLSVPLLGSVMLILCAAGFLYSVKYNK